MEIKVKITKSSNAKYFRCKLNSIQYVDFESYIGGVVASEIGNAPLEACKAQAIAARTTACAYIKLDKAISDSGSSAQAFNADRMYNNAYEQAHLGASLTQGEVLYYNGTLCQPCSFSASNGGHTTSSQERWGGFRAWLIEKVDPWDYAALGGKKTGHGVGMSQAGAKYAAKNGVDYKKILSFYYPNTTIKNINGDDTMATYKDVKASYLIDKFKMMKENNWKYVANSAQEGAVDCSGAFTYWYKKAGSYMYHGSNTMYRKYSTEKGEIGQIKLVPGMAVYRWHNDGKEPSQYRSDGLGNFSHVGMYIGNGKCIEAKGTKSGIVESDISTWSYASKLKYTIYDVTEDETVQPVIDSNATVTTSGGKLNLRKSIGGAIAVQVSNGTRLHVEDQIDDWYVVKYNNKTLYAKAEFIKKDIDSQSYSSGSKYKITFTVDESDKDRIAALLKSNNIDFSAVKVG